MKLEIYILTYNKKINQDYESEIYKPLICGANTVSETHGYLCDNTGDNISDLNKYYTELTGEYWAWKNSDADILGFCHYRRWFVKNFKFDKLTKEEIFDDLRTHDIILPLKLKFTKSLYDVQKELDIQAPDYDVTYEDYLKIESILEKYYPEYSKYYKKVMNGKEMYTNNMFICKWELANKYFEWLFDVLKILENELDLTKYKSRDTRIFGFIGERLLTTFIMKNNFKIKEYDLYCTENLIPYLYLINCRYPRIQNMEYQIFYFIKNLQKKISNK